ncbi:MAG: protein kinase domain-containing protein, partial [Planctomycetota bacterium]
MAHEDDRKEDASTPSPRREIPRTQAGSGSPPPADAADAFETLPAEPPTRVHDEGSGPPADGPSRREIGPYRILEEIGRGGMGVVYRAFHSELKREVALKVLIAGEDASEEAISRFHREAESVAKLGHHPNIVPIYDIGKVVGAFRETPLHYFAMHFVEGKPLDRLIDDGEVTPKRAAFIARKVAQALEHAHQHGVLHRDVKPANILLTADGEPQITDFGLAKDVLSDEKVTRTGTTMGSPNYMSPEQADGRIEEIDHRTDIYGLGATLYEMLATRPPFEGATVVNIIQKVILHEPVSPRKWNPACPPDLDTICLKALEKNPGRRYASASAMAEDLRRFLESEPIQARPASFAYRFSKRVRRNPAAYGVAMVGSLLLFAAGTFFLGFQPAMERASEIRAERSLLDTAWAERITPQTRAEALLAKARKAFEAGEYAACAQRCKEVEDRYGDLQGSDFKAMPPIRYPALLGEEKYAVLKEPYSFPLAEAAALRAHALAAVKDEEGARGAWARAYWRARAGRPGGKALAEKDTEILKTALAELGRRLLDRKEFRRARGTFEEALTRFPEPKGGPGTFGLARALLGLNRLEEARDAFQSCRAGGGFKDERQTYAEEVVDLLRTILPETRFPHPAAGKIMIGCHPLPFDVDEDGREEILWFTCEKGTGLRVRVQGYRNGKMEVLHTQTLPTVGDWRQRQGYLLATSADLERDGKKEVVAYLCETKDRNAEIDVFRWRRGKFHRVFFLRDTCHTWPKMIRSGDLDRDGREEVLVAFHNPQGAVRIYRGTPEGLAISLTLDLESFPYGLEVWEGEKPGQLVLSMGPYNSYRIVNLHLDLGARRVLPGPSGEAFRAL